MAIGPAPQWETQQRDHPEFNGNIPFARRFYVDRRHSIGKTGKEFAMTLKMLSIAALALTLASGAAFAQTDPALPTDPGAEDKQMPQVDPTVTNALEDKTLMGPFFTDDTMTTMRSADEMKTAWAAMTDENRMTVKKNCESSDSIKYREFCGAVEGMAQ